MRSQFLKVILQHSLVTYIYVITKEISELEISFKYRLHIITLKLKKIKSLHTFLYLTFENQSNHMSHRK